MLSRWDSSRSLLDMRERATLTAAGVGARVAATAIGLVLIVARTAWRSGRSLPVRPVPHVLDQQCA